MKVKSLEVLHDMWEQDKNIDETKLETEALRVPNLHGKYLNIMSTHSSLRRMKRREYEEEKHIMRQYYRGELNNPQDLQKYGLPKMNFKIMKAEVDSWLDADQKLNDLKLKIGFHEEIVEYCKEVLKNINNRGWYIKTSTEHIRWMAGDR